MSARGIFTRSISAIEHIFNVSFSGETVEDKIVSMREMCLDDYSFAEKITKHSRYIRDIEYNNVKGVKRFNLYDCSESVATCIFSSILSGVASKRTESDPKTHHWLPVVYLRNFDGTTQAKKRNVRASISGIGFFKTGAVQVAVNDLQFAHDRGDDGSGYYDLAIENMFSNIETYYSQISHRLDENTSYLNAVIFATVQMVRNPDMNNNFHSGSIESIIGKIIEVLDQMGRIFVNVVSSKKPLPFTPYIPARIKIKANGMRTIYFPVSKDMALLINNNPLGIDKQSRMMIEMRESVINNARKSNSIIFGIEMKEVENI